MKRIIIHWTAGAYTPNDTDLGAYHYLIGYDPKTDSAYLKNGKFKPEDNLNCNDGIYARHTGGGNTGSIGISLCSMFGYENNKDVGKYPIKEAQLELLYQTCANLSKKYNIPITPLGIMTHYEFGKRNPNTESRGKRDIEYLPSRPDIASCNIGDYIRDNIKKCT